ncbi:MAG: DUF4381 family protein [Kiloniellales bacterium]|nr:DUF4381 family protein [Kiloniellales bacterium]
MTPEELLRDLRDIHLPVVSGGGSGFELAIEPFLILAALLLLLGAVSLRRRRLWRHQARAQLRRIDDTAAPVEQWPQLLELVRQTARLSRARPPDCVYLPMARIGSAEIALTRRYLRDSLRT